MTSSTRGPRPGKVPPHIQDRVDRKHARAQARAARGPWYRAPLFMTAVGAVVALVVGIVIGRAAAPDPVADHLADAESAIGIADGTELIWVFGLQSGTPSVQSARDAFERDGADVTAANLDAWLAAYDQSITALQGTGEEPAVDGVRRLLLASAQAGRDGVQTLGAAAAADGRTRAALLEQVDILRARALALDFEARQLYVALGGELEGGLPAPPSPGPSLPRPSPPAPPSPPGPPPTGAPTGPTSGPSPTASEEASPRDRSGRPERSESESEPAAEPTADRS